MPRAIETIDINTTVLHYEETVDGVTETVAYIPVVKTATGVIVLRDVALGPNRINPTNDANYINSELDASMNNADTGYLSRFDEKMLACIIPTTIKYKPPDSDEVTEIARQVFLPSASEMGFTGVADEGESFLPVLKAHRDTTNGNAARIGYNSAGTAVVYWLRSADFATRVRSVYANGGLGSNNASFGNVCWRPAFQIANGTMVSDETEDTIYILPDSEKLYRELQFVAYVGTSTDRPKKARVEVDITNATESQIWVSNNAKDESPVWVACTNGVAVELPNTTKTTDNWELGVKVYAKSGGRAVCGEPVVMVEVDA